MFGRFLYTDVLEFHTLPLIRGLHELPLPNGTFILLRRHLELLRYYSSARLPLKHTGKISKGRVVKRENWHGII